VVVHQEKRHDCDTSRARHGHAAKDLPNCSIPKNWEFPNHTPTTALMATWTAEIPARNSVHEPDKRAEKDNEHVLKHVAS